MGGVASVLGAINLDKGAALVQKLFEDNGWQKPTMSFTETETTIEIVINGSKVSDTPLEQDFYSNYWWGKMRFTGHYGRTSDDTLNVAFQIYHHAGAHRPHDPDILEGEVAAPSVSINSGTAGQSKKSGQTFAASADDTKWVKHPGEHSDEYVAHLQATCFAGSIWCDINDWGYELRGKHLADKPISLKCIGGSGLLGGLAKFAIEANENVHAIASLDLVIEFNPELDVGAADVELGSLLSRSESTLDLDLHVSPLTSRGSIGLSLKARDGFSGPGTIATINFHLPPHLREQSYLVHCAHLEARNMEGALVTIGGDDAYLTVNPQPNRNPSTGS